MINNYKSFISINKILIKEVINKQKIKNSLLLWD